MKIIRKYPHLKIEVNTSKDALATQPATSLVLRFDGCRRPILMRTIVKLVPFEPVTYAPRSSSVSSR